MQVPAASQVVTAPISPDADGAVAPEEERTRLHTPLQSVGQFTVRLNII